jgi:simple sugar transport system ATP-binding protein
VENSFDATGAAAVRVTNVSKVFGPTRALENVSFDVAPGTIHALLGRNGAGKSTMVSLLAGLSRPTSGSIDFFGGQGHVGTVFQHSMLVPTLSVAENMFLGCLPRSGGRIDWRAVRHQTRQRLDDWGLDVSEDALVSDLTVAERQLVEIVRELSRGSGFVILDEPTARIRGPEITRLHERVRRARDAGTTFIYISHHLSEVMEICDHATVLRDGRVVSTRPVPGTEAKQFVMDMVGSERPEAGTKRPAPTTAGPPVLEVRRAAAGNILIEVLSLKPGEMVGLAGVVGSGKEAFGAMLAGMQPADKLDATIDGRTLKHTSPRDAIDSGVGYVPPDRHHQGLILSLPVGDNVALPVIRRFANRLGILSLKAAEQFSARLMREMDVKASSPRQLVSMLSGGNQQKTVLARAMSARPRLLVLVNPTTGVDIASKANIYKIISDARSEGTAVLLISDETDEFAMCDRVLVMKYGRIEREFSGTWQARDLVSAIEGVEN